MAPSQPREAWEPGLGAEWSGVEWSGHGNSPTCMGHRWAGRREEGSVRAPGWHAGTVCWWTGACGLNMFESQLSRGVVSQDGIVPED